MRSVCATVATLLLAASAAACFSESPIDDNPMSTSDDGGCTPGSLSCECYGNGTCDPALECAPETSTCVPAGCELGEVHCLCDHGSCDEPLLCIAGMCAAPSDSSGSSDSFTSTNAEGSSSSADGSESSDGGSTGVATTQSESESEGGSSSTTESPVDCTALDCDECVYCVVEPGQPCADEADACGDAAGCGGAAECMVQCGALGLCEPNCCTGLDAPTQDLAHAVNQCRRDTCAVPCGGYVEATCE
jgi:hypothetical protein